MKSSSRVDELIEQALQYQESVSASALAHNMIQLHIDTDNAPLLFNVTTRIIRKSLPYHAPSQTTCQNSNHTSSQLSALQRPQTPRISRSTRPGRRAATSNLEHASDTTNSESSPPTPSHANPVQTLQAPRTWESGWKLPLYCSWGPVQATSSRNDPAEVSMCFVGLDCLLPKAYSATGFFKH